MARQHHGFHRPGSLPGYSCRRQQNWRHRMARSWRVSSKTRTLASSAKLARQFTALVRACNASNQADVHAAQTELTNWLTEARAAGVPAMPNFLLWKEV